MADAALDFSGLTFLDEAGQPTARESAPALDFSGLRFEDEPGLGDRLANAPKALVHGLTDVVASLPKQGSIIASQIARERLRAINEPYAPPQGDSPNEIAAARIRRSVTGRTTPKVAAERRAILEAEANQPVQERPAYRAGEAFARYVKSAMPTDERLKDEWLAQKIPHAMGSTLGFLGTGVVGRVLGLPAALTSAWAGSAAQSVEQFEDAIRHKASLADAFKAANLAAVVGTSEAAPIATLLDRLDKGTGGSVKRVIRNAIVQGTEEAIQEAFQNISSNLIANQLVAYDPQRGTFSGTGEAAGLGFTVGGLMTVLGHLAMGRRARGAQQQPTDQAGTQPPASADIPEGTIPAKTLLPEPADEPQPPTPLPPQPQPQTDQARTQPPAAEQSNIPASTPSTPSADIPEGAIPAETLLPEPADEPQPQTPQSAQPQSQTPLPPQPQAPAPIPAHATLTRAAAAGQQRTAIPQAVENMAATAQALAAESQNPAVGITANEVANDRQDQPGLPGQIGIGAQSVQAEPVPTGGREAAEAGRVVQAQAAQGASSSAVAPPTIGGGRGGGEGGATDASVTPDAKAAALPTASPRQIQSPAEEAVTSAPKAAIPLPPAPIPDGSSQAPVQIESSADVHVAADRTAEPTPAQAKAGNYSKRHLRWNGLDISIEVEAGQNRRGIGPDGTPWSVTMPHPYGYIRRSEGADGDQVDITMGPNPQARDVYLIDQIDPKTGKFDEIKSFAGFNTEAEVISAYNSSFSDGSGPSRLGAIKAMPVEEFKSWLAKADKTKAIAYKRPRARPKPSNRKRRPLDIVEFLASIGGIRSDEKLIADLRGIFGNKNKFVPGIGQLIRKPDPYGRLSGPKFLDRAREAAAEAGYLPMDSTLSDLLELVDRNERGDRVYSVQDEAEVERQREERFSADMARAKKAVHKAVGDNGIKATDGEISDAAELVVREGRDPLDAIETIIERASLADDAASAQDDQIEDIPFDGDTVTPSARAVGEAPSPVSQPARIDAEPAAEQAPPRLQPDEVQRDRRQAEKAAAAERGPEPAQAGDRTVREGESEQTESLTTGQGRDTTGEGFDTSQEFWHGTTHKPFTRFKPPTEKNDTLGPAIYLSRGRAGANFYGEGRGGVTLGPFYVRGNIVKPDTIVPFQFNADGTVKNRAPAQVVLGWLRQQLITGRRDPWGEGMSPAEYTREYWKRRGVDGYDGANGLEVAIYDPDNIRAGFEIGADGKPQTVIPGAERISQGEQAKRAAAEPLRPKVAQKPADEGLFSDDSRQTDMVDMLRSESARQDVPERRRAEIAAREAGTSQAAVTPQTVGVGIRQQTEAPETGSYDSGAQPIEGLIERIPGDGGTEILIVQNSDGKRFNVVMRDTETQQAVGPVSIVASLGQARQKAKQVLRGPEAKPANARSPAKPKGTALYSLGRQSPDLRGPSYRTPRERAAYQAKARKLAADMRAELDRLGLTDINLRIVPKIEAWFQGRLHTADGRYFERVIDIAMKSSADHKTVLTHEAVHAMRELGLFTEPEWRLLAKAANDLWRKQFDIDARYKGQSEEVLVEEAVAHAAAAWGEKQRVGDGRVARLIRRIHDFLRAVGNAIRRFARGTDLTSAEDIFRAIHSGEIGHRPRRQPAESEDARFALQPITPASSAQQRQRTMQGFLARGQPIDRVLRMPFEILGGTTDDGKWRPGLYLWEKNSTALAGALLGARLGAAITNPIGAAVGHAAGRLVGGAAGARAGEAVAAFSGGLPGAAAGALVGTVAGKLFTARFSPNGRFAFMNPVLETARHGLIDRYNLRNLPEYIERERAVALDKRTKLAQAEEALKAIDRAGVSVDEAKVLHAILTEKQVGPEELNRLAKPIRAAIEDWGQEAVRYGLISQESFERFRGTYLHRAYQKHELEENGLGRMVGKMLGSYRKRIVGNQLKGRGMFRDIEVARLMKDVPEWHQGARGNPQKGDKFIRLDELAEQQEILFEGEPPPAKVKRIVWWPADRPVPDRYSGFRNEGTWEVRGQRDGKLVLWRDFTKAEREKMGEILDARYTFAKTAMQAAHDLAVGKFYWDIAQNEDWAKSGRPEGRVIDAAEWQKSGRAYLRQDHDWVRVPDTDIPGTGGKKRYGALTGKYVREEIWRDIHEMNVMRDPGAFAAFWRSILTQWKLNKTARTPTTHVNNVMSNFFLMDMMDVRLQDFVRGLNAYRTGDRDYQEALANGAFGSDMIAQEIRDNTLKPILDDIAKQLTTQPTLRQGGMLGRISKVADLFWTGVKKVDGWARWAYQAEDEIFRMATYLRRRQLGDTPREAAKVANEQFINYDIRAPWVRAARNTVLPFISYTYRAVPLVANAAATRPWKIAKYALLAYVANAIAYALSGGDEDKERRLLREQEQGRTWLGSYRMTRMPFNDSHGNPLFLDMRNWVPAGNVFDFGDGDIPAWMVMGGPLVIGAELALNRSMFTGQDISNEKTDDWWDRQSLKAAYAFKAFAPNMPLVPGSYSWDRIASAMMGGTTRDGRPYSVPLAISSSLGLKLRPHDLEDAEASRSLEFRSIQRALDSKANRLRRRLSRNLITQSAYEREMADIEKKRARLMKRAEETFKN